MEKANKILTAQEIIDLKASKDRSFEQEKEALVSSSDEADDSSTVDLLVGIGSVFFSPIAFGALLLIGLIGLGAVALWETQVQPAISEFSQVKEVNTDPRIGEVRVSKFVVKECDGTTLVYTTAKSLFTTETEFVPDSPECQPIPPLARTSGSILPYKVSP